LVHDITSSTKITNTTQHSNTIMKSLMTFMIEPGVSLDYLDIYRHAEKQEMDIIDMNIGIDHHGDNDDMSELHGHDDDVCQICFDEFEGNDVSISPCGHSFCISCWRGALRSAASSGDAEIKCASFRCSNTLGIRDVAHMLFDFEDSNNTTDGNTTISSLRDINVLINLMRFRMERYLLEATSSREKSAVSCRMCSDQEEQVVTAFRFCPTPSCNRFFPVSKNKFEYDTAIGSDIMMCPCDASICKNCHQPSHLGVSCETYRKIRKEIDSGRLDDELKSLKWIKTETQPCPKCQFPINKNGGCNHVRCGKCNYYFCWHCGGMGHLCGSFVCRNGKRSDKYSEFEDESSSFQLPEQVQAIMDYAKADWEYEHIMRKQTQPGVGLELSFEIQARQIIKWAQNAILSAFLFQKHKKKIMKLWKVIVPNLELIITAMQVIKARNEVAKSKKTFEEDEYNVTVPSLLDMTKEALEGRVNKDATIVKHQKKVMTKRQEQKKAAISLKRGEREGTSSAIDTLLSENISLSQILCTMNLKRLKKTALVLMSKIVELLVSISQPTMHKKSPSRNAFSESGPLNKRMGVLKAPWKKKYLYEDEVVDTKVDHTDERWKGKSRVKQLRRHNLSLRISESSF